MSLIKYPQLYNRQILEKLIDDYGTDNAIAKQIGCYWTTVCRARHRMGMKKPYGGQEKYPVLHDPAALKQLLAECGSYSAVARKIGCGKWTVRDAVAKLRLEERKE